MGQFVGYKFANEKYADGETAIVTALRKIIEEDIPKMRPDADKKLLIFTDGRSSEDRLYDLSNFEIQSLNHPFCKNEIVL